MSQPLEDYTAAQQERALFEADNSLVLNQYADLNVAVDGAELALKVFARDNGPEENAYFTVTVQAKRHWLDTAAVTVKPKKESSL
ncbi:MAG: hypothetical protein Q7O66_00795 [Dehalococcoidia bacterium]|nr:hypothetical protein [Dehalococcoidia bacterium]